MTRLRAHNLNKSYKGRHVVNNVSLEISKGEVVGLLGPNGAGKTTCFYMIVGLVQTDNGSIFLGDTNITVQAVHQRARLGIGYLPQEASVFRKMTTADNILAILELRKTLSKNDRLAELDKLLDELHITHIRDVLGMSLSGGERRRVEIARALARDPQFILLDEPFAGVDPISVIDIKQIIKQLQARDIGIFITDHNVRETLDICEKAYIMNQGKLIAQGTPTEILSHKQVREVYLGEDFYL